jgi:hypothetical protein
MRLMPAVLLPALLAGCTMVAPQPAPPYPSLPDANACGADGLRQVIGLPVAVLPPNGPWSALRVIRPGDGVTMDYSASRLNVMVDDGGRITQVTCG